jgi:dihydrofolate synthase / folylpolyglutamate synthase
MKKTLQQWLSWQEKLHWQSIDLGLERCRIVADRLELLKPDFKIITVAGTNGKGSSVVMLENIYKSNGYNVGRYTTPHLLTYNERIVINGKIIEDKEICEAFEKIEEKRGDVSLTSFEYGTLVAVWLFNKNQIDIAILEVGMGGRLDAVNLWNADAALITAIDIDHAAFLGNDRESIAREKAGILRPYQIAVCSDPNPPQSLLHYAKQLKIDLKVFKRDFELEETYKNLLQDLPAYQLQNAAGALQLIELINKIIPTHEQNLKKGLQNFHWTGRFQKISAPFECFVDVAHNPQGAKVLKEALQHQPCKGETFALVGMLKDKDISNTLKAILPVVDHWNVASLSGERGEQAIVLEDNLRNLGISEIQTYLSIWEGYQNLLLKLNSLDRLIIFGSFLAVAAILEQTSL